MAQHFKRLAHLRRGLSRSEVSEPRTHYPDLPAILGSIRVSRASPQCKQQYPKEFVGFRVGRDHPSAPSDNDLCELFVPRGRRNVGTAIEYLVARVEIYELF